MIFYKAVVQFRLPLSENYSFTPAGIFARKARDLGAKDGNLGHVTDFSSRHLCEFDSAGNLLSTVLTASQGLDPLRVDIDNDGNRYVTHGWSGTIEKPTG